MSQSKLRFGRCPRHGWVLYRSPPYIACPGCGAKFLEEVPIHSLIISQYMRDIIVRSIGFEEIEIDDVFETDPVSAVLFAIHSSNSYFPLNSRHAVNIRYDASYFRRLGSLVSMGNVLKGRRYVCLKPLGKLFPSGAIFAHSSRATFERAALELAEGFKEEGVQPNEVIVCYTGGEDFYGVVAGFSLRKRGYIVFPEGVLDLPIAGLPDLTAAKLGDLQGKLINQGIIWKGAFLAELELSKVFGKTSNGCPIITEKEMIVVEVEPKKLRASSGRSQLKEKYLPMGYFNNGYLACPNRQEDTKDQSYPELGLITWDEDGNELLYDSETDWGAEKNVKTAIDLAKRHTLFTLLKNVPTKSLSDKYNGKPLSKIVDDITTRKATL